MGIERGAESIEIEAPSEACFETIIDYASYADWIDAVKSVEVKDHHADGVGRRVEIHADLRVREVTYVLDYTHRSPDRVSWNLVEADLVKAIEGEYRFEPTATGTRATYSLGIDPGIPLPGMVVRRVGRELMRRTNKDLKAEVERRLQKRP